MRRPYLGVFHSRSLLAVFLAWLASLLALAVWP